MPLDTAMSIEEIQVLEFLKDSYDRDYCRQLEFAYGSGMMSEGGDQAIEKMFSGIEMRQKRVLDFGCGLGGVAMYLARNKGANIIGVDINEAILEDASSRIPQDLEGFLDFKLLENGHTLVNIEDESIDIVYSKGVITHLPPKQRERVYREFQRVLKPGGILVITDWMSTKDGAWGPRIEKLMEDEDLAIFAQSPLRYLQTVSHGGFVNIEYKDCSHEYALYNQEIVSRLKSPDLKQAFIQYYGQELYFVHLEGYEGIAGSLEDGELICAWIKAEKPKISLRIGSPH